MPGRGHWHEDLVAWARGFDSAPSLRVYLTADDYLANQDEARAGCVVADEVQPDLHGTALVEALVENKAGLPAIVMTPRPEIDRAVQYIRAGALDYLDYSTSRDRFRAAFLSALEASARRDELRQQREAIERRLESLTTREKEILDLLTQGRASRPIADLLGLSKRTVDYHRGRVKAKVGVASSLELVALVGQIRVLELREQGCVRGVDFD